MDSFDNNQGPIIKKTSLFKKLFYDYFKILIIVDLLFVFIVGYFAFVNPKLIEVKNNISAKKQEKEEKIKSLENYLQKLQNYKRDYENVSKEDRKKIDLMLPEGFSYEDMYRQIELTARKIGLEVISLDISADIDKKASTGRKRRVITKTPTKTVSLPENIGKVSVSMEIGGLNYSGLKNVLAAYEKNLRIVDIQKISWQPNGETVNLTFNTYYLIPQKQGV